MPYANAIGATPNSLTSIAIYMGNQEHSHHADFEVTPIQVLGAKSIQDFLQFALSAFQSKSRKRQAGRKPKNAADWIIVRTPDGANLTTEEMAAYESAVRDEAGIGGPVVGLLNWHRNKHTGAADMNLLAAAWTSFGHAVRDRGRHPIKHLRWRMDRVTDALNSLRKTRGMPLIQTMKEVKQAQARERGEQDAVELLAKLPKPPSKVEELEAGVLAIGAEITRYNPGKDSISFKLQGRKKAKRFRVSSLMDEVAKMAKSLQVPTPEPQLQKRVTQPEKEEVSLPEMPEINLALHAPNPEIPELIEKKKKRKKKQRPDIN